MAEVVFREARRDDVPSIVTLLADDGLGATRETVREDVDADYWCAFDAIDGDPRNALIVVDRDGEMVGTMQLTFIPSLSRRGAERMQIEAVRVRGDLRGAGIGRQMMEWAVGQARQRGCRLVQLTTDKQRAEAHRFYARLGFVASHEGMKLTL
ncbi:GNAT family N-acetyltransferase [Micromonospora sp. NPDC049679]|uniref:GNAT family N-acetyltransferase n=1 Tax=Micromonospora sp. NPDC049679 TaxID=3155920 RepID=UPI00340DE46D